MCADLIECIECGRIIRQGKMYFRNCYNDTYCKYCIDKIAKSEPIEDLFEVLGLGFTDEY